MGGCCGRRRKAEEEEQFVFPAAPSKAKLARFIPGKSTPPEAKDATIGICHETSSTSYASSRAPTGESSGSNLGSGLGGADGATEESSGSGSTSESQTSRGAAKEKPPEAEPSTQLSSTAQPLPPPALPSKTTQSEGEPCWERHFSTEPWGPTEHTSCTEFRIRLPLSLAEYEKAQIHAVNETAKKMTGGGNGVEVVRIEPFGPETDNNAGPPPFGVPGSSGVYTDKIYRMRHMVPAAIRALVPDDLSTLEEKAWNAYPLARTVVTNRKFNHRDGLILISTTHRSGGDAQVPNALNLPAELLRIRKVVHLDITDDAVMGGRKSKNYKAEEDPKLLRTCDGRGPFLPGWEKDYTGPQMMVYKVIAIRFRFPLVAGKLRSWMLGKTYPNLFAQSLRIAVCSYDVWSRLSLAQLREMEKKTTQQLREQMKRGQAAIALED